MFVAFVYTIAFILSERQRYLASRTHLANEMTDLGLLSFSPTKHSDIKTHKATGSLNTSAPLPFAYTSVRFYACVTEWQGKKTIHVNDHAVPLLSDPVQFACSYKRVRRHERVLFSYTEVIHPVVFVQNDVILRVTSTAICGSDLHLYLNAMPGHQAAPCVLLSCVILTF